MKTKSIEERYDADSFVKEILEYNPNADVKLLTSAFNLAREAHKDQFRASGESYFEHPLQVGELLMSLRAGSATISAALLHDVVEETPYTIKDLEKRFGKDVASLVEGLTNVDKLDFDQPEEYKAENIRKILLATTKDMRIMLIKLCDRLHNMRTLHNLKEDKQKRIARETMDIYAPIAHKLGIWWIKGELEDLAMRYLQPDIYQLLKEKISEKRHEREKHTEEIIHTIEGELRKKDIRAKVFGRAKYFYSIYRKMIKKNLDVDEVYDLIAVRIITKTIPECYSALGIVHELWTPIPRRFKDYIANPKSNGYQSLHTVVHIPGKKLLEIQIRTEEEDHFAENGVAAHWRYKGTERDKQFDKKVSWLKQLLQWRANSENAQDLIETLKLDLFDNEIVVFTPMGDPISLPEGSTPVDFAYEVHTSIGEHCSKALVNGKAAPLDTQLKAGDQVEIITKKNATPARQWLNFVASNKAKAKIKNTLNVSAEAETKKKAHQRLSSKNPADLIKVKREKTKSMPLKISKCCSPTPGDKIVGYMTKDKKITVHEKECPNIHTLDENKRVDVDWKEQLKETRNIRITLEDKDGILTKILNLFVRHKMTLRNVNTRKGRENTFNLILEIEEPDEETLDELVKKLRAKTEVMNVVKD